MNGTRGVQAWFASNDVDCDGLPDDWEQQIVDDNPGDDINDIWDVLPWDDYDGDASTNEEEFCANTDPTDDMSFFAVVSIMRNPDTTVSVVWQCVGGELYRVEYCDEVPSETMTWLEAEDYVLAPITGMYEWIDDGWGTDTPPANVAQRSYRVMIYGPCGE